MLAFRVIQPLDVRRVQDWVLVRHLVGPEQVHHTELPTVVDGYVYVELCFQGEVLLLLGGHVAPNYLDDWIIKRKVHRQTLLTQLIRDENFLILLNVQNEYSFDQINLFQPRSQQEGAL